uniref:type VI secretion system Vgr family protein n=1 Tax=Candidatus Electrothrix sp. TaxID=2170559 RepID=UPI004057CAFC
MSSSLLTKRKFSFTSKALDADSFAVVSFTGFEAISKPYRFEIVLVSEKNDIDPLTVLQNPAVFTIHREAEQDVDFNGILLQFEETQEFNGYLFFKAVLTPKLWWLSLTHHNQVFLDMTVPEIMQETLEDTELADGIDFQFKLQDEYQPLEYVCQYRESHFDFVSRWAEREGIYYFFKQTAEGEKVVFTDTNIAQVDLMLGKELVYSPQTGLDSQHTNEVIQNFLCKHNLLPQKVYLKDYNYLKPSLAMEGIADVDPEGRGEKYIYGENFDTPEEGNRLAGIRAEELLCRRSFFLGKSSVPFMVPGFTFDLKKHYKNIYNRKYLITEVVHEGHQTGYLISGLSAALEPRDEQMFYANTFTAIYSDAQFRPERTAVKPKISGTINAKIDAATSGQYAELDEHGRYKVILPFDRSGRSGGKASAWFRMMQPYAGPNQGMHFPLHKGTEVLLTFIDGDPDQPLIAGAVPNPETSSPVTVENQTMCRLSSSRNPVSLSVGASDSSDYDIDDAKADIDDAKADIDELKENFIELENTAGEERITIHSDGDLWFEAQERYVEYYARNPSTSLVGESTNTPSELIDTLEGYAPTGIKVHSTHQNGATTFSEVINNAHVHASSLDTVNIQEGNIYDFGGYWNYNLGNSYEENHIDQKAVTLNNDYSKKYDKAGTGGPEVNITKVGEENDTWDAGNTWTTKTIKGNSYDYATEHNSLEINHHCNSYEYKYGGQTEEYTFTGEGIQTSKTISGGGKTEEWKYDRDDGSDLSHETTTQTGNTIATSASYRGKQTSSSCSLAAKASADVNLAAVASTEVNLSATASAKLNIGVTASVEANLSATSSISVSAAANATINIHTAADAAIDNTEFSLKIPALSIDKLAELKIKDGKLTLKKKLTDIQKITVVRLEQHEAWIGDNRIDIRKCEVCIIL